ncbi:hypothetical protein JW898_02885 [Candidatus Woesearchaeota archaeon]|nr:hypothetical protein [Candidatus Woesearchaeota archaeon]
MVYRTRRTGNRKAYMRTLEAFLAFFITFIFVVFVVLKGVSPKGAKTPLEILSSLEQRDDFRECVYAGNETCARLIVRQYIPSSYDLKVSIGAPAPFKGAKDIYTETVFITSNRTNDYRIVYLYYWPLSG